MKKINSLAFRMPFVICCIVVIIIVTMLISSIRIASKGISVSRLGGFNSTIAGYSSVLDTWFGLETSLINTYSVTPVIIRYLQGNETTTLELLSSTIRNFKNSNIYIINMGIADINGNIISDSVSQELIGKNLKDYTDKIEIRKLAQENGLEVAEKKDSQEICFIPDNNYTCFLEKYLKEKYKRLPEE